MATPTAPSRSPGWSIGIDDAADLEELLHRIENGLHSAAEEHLRHLLDLSIDEMAGFLGTSTRTLGRRHEKGRLTSGESERLYRYARLYERAVEVQGNQESARRWLKEEQWRLGDRVPLEVARYEPGAREVEDLLGRIEHGLPA